MAPMRTLNPRSSDVSDAMDRLSIQGVLVGFIPLLTGASAVGPAVPVSVRRSEGKLKSMREGLVDAVGSAPRGSVVVIRSESKRYSAWGGFLSRFAATRDVRGVVVDGATRDLQDIRKLRLPVFTKAISPASGHGRLAAESSGEPIQIDSVTIHLGDLVVADSDGVAIIPRGRIAQVFQETQAIRKSEKSQTGRLLRPAAKEKLNIK